MLYLASSENTKFFAMDTLLRELAIHMPHTGNDVCAAVATCGTFQHCS